MDKNTFLKISVAIFVVLAIVISLFPPYEFGNERLKTLSERRLNNKIVDKLPIKQYDFIFNDNKKLIALTYYDFVKKFYDKDSIIYYEKRWSDKKFKFNSESVDTFLTASRFLYQRNKYKRNKYRFDFEELLDEKEHKSSDISKRWLELNLSEDEYYGVDNTKQQIKGNRITKFNINETNIDAINYNDVKDKYESAPDSWTFKYVYKIDSTKIYYKYIITQPEYYLLKREILLSELIIEYFLAFLVSIVTSYLIWIIIARKKVRV